MRDVLVAFCDRLGIPPQDALLFGASAGGFWAMMTGAEVGSRAVVVDSPQTDLFRYHDTGPRDAMLRACYPEMEAADIQLIYPDRLRVIDRIKLLGKAAQKIVFVENKQDVKHVRTQWNDFFSELDQLPYECRPEIFHIRYDRIGDRGQTHTTMETDATVQLLAKVLAGRDLELQPA
jgi:pimeloyl-ACP methyl ester carboxylesterase